MASTCRCGHRVGDHSRNEGECLDCDCVLFTSQDEGYTRHAATLRALAMPVLLRIAKEESTTVADLLGRQRYSSISRARHRAAAVLRWSTGWSYPEIGAVFNRDHTSIIHSVRVYEDRLALEFRP